jgi:hypothetical protein
MLSVASQAAGGLAPVASMPYSSTRHESLAARHKYVRLSAHPSDFLFTASLRHVPATFPLTLTFLAPPPITRLGPRHLPLKMTDVDWSNAVWDSIPAYHLTKEIVDSFLQGIFGYVDFYTRVSPADSI